MTARFEVYGYHASPEDDRDIRARALGALDHHIPIHGPSDEAAARAMVADATDILNGLTKGPSLASCAGTPRR